MAAYHKPRQRKGFVLTAVAWNRDGTIRSTTYEPISKALPDHVPEAQQKVRARGILAAEQQDLFGRD